ncbi:MAG: DUF5106 domain-containing protein [Bacteroidales bacterium]
MKRKLIYVAFLVLSVVACKGQKEQVKVDNEFPLVKVPGMITSQQDAVNYVVKNYWRQFLDRERLSKVKDLSTQMDRASRKGYVLGVDTNKFEQAFTDYSVALVMLQQMDYERTCSSVKELFQKADSIALAGDSTFLFRLMTLGEKYFYDPNSPYLNEEVYIPVVEGVLASKAIGELDKMQYEYQLRIAQLNRKGTQAADFQYEKADGSKGSLYDIKGDYTLIFFNNPDCPSCAEIREALQSVPEIEKMATSGRLKVLAMYIDEQIEPWRNNKAKYPSNWIYARDPTRTLRDNTLYGLRAIPSLYLLDKDKKVLLKDAGVQAVLGYFDNLRVQN